MKWRCRALMKLTTRILPPQAGQRRGSRRLSRSVRPFEPTLARVRLAGFDPAGLIVGVDYSICHGALLLLSGSGSLTPAGGATEATFSAPTTTAVMVKVIEDPAGRSTISLI